MTLAVVDDRNIVQDQRILDSGSSRHHLNDERLLENPRDCDSECTLPDGNSLRVTKVGSVLLNVIVRSKPRTARLTDVHLAPLITGTSYRMESGNIRGSNSYMWMVFSH